MTGYLRHTARDCLLQLVLLMTFLSCSTPCPPVYTYQVPAANQDGLNTGSLAQVGMDSLALTNLIDCIYANKFDQVHSLLVYKDGLLVLEEYMEGNKYQWDGNNYHGERIKWHKDSLHTIMSCTKSVTSAIAGIAVEQGYLKVDEPIFRYLPAHQHYKNSGKENITIEHLLTMTSGLEWDEWSGAHGTTANDIDRIYFECQEDPVACILENELTDTPGNKFNYNGGNMIVLGEILKNAVGTNIGDFGKKYLFEPLGIDSVYWYQFANGVYATDGSVRITPRDMVKIGVTFLQGGVWQGQQIISKAWVKKSQVVYNDNRGINVPIDDTGRNGYGYTWWINSIEGMKLFQASGWGGQEIIIIPEHEMVIVFTGGNYVVKKYIHKMLKNYILAALS